MLEANQDGGPPPPVYELMNDGTSKRITQKTTARISSIRGVGYRYRRVVGREGGEE